MMRHVSGFTLAVALVTLACVDNDAPGNDREATLDPPEPAAEMVSVDSAVSGVSTGLLFPEVMTDADMRSIRVGSDRCLFRYTRVGLPVVVFGADAAVVKLNGKLVRLPAAGDGVYRDGGVNVTHRELEDGESSVSPAELVLRLRDAPDELGFHGFTECPANGRDGT